MAQKPGWRRLFPLLRLDGVRFSDDMPPPPSVSALSRPAREARLVGLLGKVAALEKTVAEPREETARRRRLTSRPAIKPSGIDHAPERVKPAEQAKRRFR